MDGPAAVTSLDALQELLREDLWEYGPEPEGVVEINRRRTTSCTLGATSTGGRWRPA